MKVKQTIPEQTNAEGNLPQLPGLIRNSNEGLKVPDGYFDSLSPRIVDRINDHTKESLLKVKLPAYRKPVIWAPILAATLVAVLLIFVIPSKKEMPAQVSDEWTEISMAYDASYAEEALLAEGQLTDPELANTVYNTIGDAVFTSSNEPTEEEIARYLKEHEIESDILIAN